MLKLNWIKRDLLVGLGACALAAATMGAANLIAPTANATPEASVQPEKASEALEPGDIFLIDSAPGPMDPAVPGPGVTGRIIKNARDVKPLVQWVGIHTSARHDRFLNVIGDSAYSRGWLVRCRTQEDFARVWKEHKGDALEPTGRWSMIPRIDFDTHEVVAFFRASGVNTDGEAVERIVIAEDRVILRFDSESYQTSTGLVMGDEPKAEEDPHPGRSYGIWVIPRTDLPIHVEENRSGMHHKPLRYEPVLTLPTDEPPIRPW